MQRQLADGAVGLGDIMAERRGIEQLAHLAFEAVAQAAEIDFLQADHVKRADIGGNARKRALFGGAGQHLAVQAGEIAEIAVGGDGSLNVVAENTHGGQSGKKGRRQRYRYGQHAGYQIIGRRTYRFAGAAGKKQPENG